MEILETKDRDKFTKVILKTQNGERIELEIFKNNNVIRVNSGFGDISITPRTSNEFDILITE